MNSVINKLKAVKLIWQRGVKIKECFKILKELELQQLNSQLMHVVLNNIGCYFYRRKKFWAALDYTNRSLKLQQSNLVLQNHQHIQKELNIPLKQYQFITEEIYKEYKFILSEQQIQLKFSDSFRENKRKSYSFNISPTSRTQIQASPELTQRKAQQIRKCYVSPRRLPQLPLPQLKLRTSPNRVSPSYSLDQLFKLYVDIKQKYNYLRQLIKQSDQNDQIVKKYLIIK
ncbi:hypothetical protein pb186bvf_003517 [Paramecium bursaria]